ncbi:MAG: MAPEG family protein [Pseudomonadales bacterium]|nr:MAPEG family protein [Pseudomonadales bacterium]
MKIALICIALLGALVIGLGLYVTICRGKTKTITGTIEDPDNILNKAMRAHGNTVEFAPVLALLIYVLGMMHPDTWVVWCMMLVTASRYLIVVGLIFPQTMAKPNLMRFIGALGTYLGGAALCVALVLKVL